MGKELRRGIYRVSDGYLTSHLAKGGGEVGGKVLKR